MLLECPLVCCSLVHEVSQSYLDLWRSFQGNTTIWELQLYHVPIHEASRQQVRDCAVAADLRPAFHFSNYGVFPGDAVGRNSVGIQKVLPGRVCSFLDEQCKQCQKPSWFSRSCDVALKHVGSEVALYVWWWGFFGVFFLVVSFYFLFKFVGSFFSMICLSFGGLLVVFVGSLTG